MDGFDAIIHQPNRLRIMAVAVALEGEAWVDFTTLKNDLELTDGNLGAQITKLEEAGYLEVDKRFVGKRPKTLVRSTMKGRAAFEGHRNALVAMLGDR